jgi:hypothetical protein
MTQIFLLQNQNKLFLSKQNKWVDGRDLGCLYKTRHKDEALNQLFEVNAKDYSQRIHVLGCPIKANGFPQIDPADLPAPMETSTEVVDTQAETLDDSAADCGDDSGNQSALAFNGHGLR